ncbi:hypothetical protein Hanom_Chr04g00319881 [Helianthus anomalus]
MTMSPGKASIWKITFNQFLKVHGWSMCFTKILNLVPSFPKVHVWSMWFAVCNTCSLQLLPKVHGWSLYF